MSARQKVKIGQTFETRNSGIATLVEYRKAIDITVSFPTGYKVKTTLDNLRKGNVKDPYYKSVYGVGYLGEGKYSQTKTPRIYKLWVGILGRCYNESAQLNSKNHTYSDCIVSTKWRCLQTFGKDVESMTFFDKKNFHLDKDLRVLGNRKYSKRTCCFVPAKINTLKLFTPVISHKTLIRGKTRWRVTWMVDAKQTMKIFRSEHEANEYTKTAQLAKVDYALTFEKYLHSDIIRNIKLVNKGRNRSK